MNKRYTPMGREIERIRREKGISQAQLSRRCVELGLPARRGFTKQHYQNLLSGHSPNEATTWYYVMLALGLNRKEMGELMLLSILPREDGEQDGNSLEQ